MEKANGYFPSDQREWTIGDLKDAIREIQQEAQTNAAFLERDRPYSSPPPSRHPVWSDELRAESARLREEGLLDEATLHPWDADPERWPSADPTTQALLVAVAAERQEWEAIQAEFGDEVRYGVDDVAFSNANWTASNATLNLPEAVQVTGDQVQTARDYMLTYGHAGYVRGIGEPTQGMPAVSVASPAPARTAWDPERVAKLEAQLATKMGKEREGMAR
jgi:hypothetical protein